MSDTMSNMSFVPLPGSERGPIPSAVPAGSLDGSERIEITIVTRRKAELPRTASGVPVRLSRDELRQQYGSDPADQALVADVLTGLGLGLEVTSRDPGSRRLKVAGPVSALARAFGTTLSLVTSTGPGQSRPVTHRYRQGGLQIPAQLAGVVVAVLGLDNRPQARPHVRRAELAAQQVSYTPPQVAAIYQFPEGTDGTGQTIAIIEFGGGFVDTDLDTYFPSLGLAVPSVTVVGVDGASNGGVEGQDPPDDYFEVALDIEVAGSVAPGAALVVYFAPGSDQGWLDAVSEAIQATPTPTAVSISWGGSEDNGDAQGNAALDAVFADAVALGVNVCVSSGDGGSSDGVGDGNPHCDFPASSPHVLACGGTSLQADPATGVISSETVWNDSSGVSGGGVSDVFAPPAWQAAAGVSANPGGGTGRGVPDVAGNADPGTGYLVLFNNNQLLGGGTSAVAPLWAALTCRWAQAVGGPLGVLLQQGRGDHRQTASVR
jgi:kumamolisin